MHSRRLTHRRRRGAPICGAALAILALAPLAHRDGIPTVISAAPRVAAPTTARAFARLPLVFEANRGQTDASVKYLAHGPGYTLFLNDAGAVLSLSSRSDAPSRGPGDGAVRALPDDPTRPAVQETALRLRFTGPALALSSAMPPRIMGEDRLPGIVNYFIGRDPRRWQAGVPTYARVAYHNVYPGVDAVYYGTQGRLEYDLVLAPGTRPDAIALTVDGARSVGINGDGDLVMRTPLGDIVQERPVVYQMIGRVRRLVAGRYIVAGRGEIRFRVGAYDASKPLVIDPLLRISAGGGGGVSSANTPVLRYAAHLGGNGVDDGRAIAVDGAGAVYVSGATESANFPTRAAQQGHPGGYYDGFVTKLNAAGTAISFSTYLGGADSDSCLGMAVDDAGDSYLTGDTTSEDFPTRGPLQAAYGGGGYDAFAARLDPAGRLVYSTYLGGRGADYGLGVAVDGAGHAYITGYTASPDFPTRAALQPAYGPVDKTGGASGTSGQRGDAFVAELSPSGAESVFSTYLGSGGRVTGNSIAVDRSGGIYVTGYTSSAAALAPGAPRGPYGGGQFDAFVAKLAPGGRRLLYVTGLGGAGYDAGNAIAVDSAGIAYVTGYTTSTNFPMRRPLRAAYGGGSGTEAGDAFVSALDASGALAYSTYLGGDGFDVGYGLAVDGVGDAYITGYTNSTNFPLYNNLTLLSGSGTAHAFVAKLNPVGSAFAYSTLLPGEAHEYGRAVALDNAGDAYVTGVAVGEQGGVAPGSMFVDRIDAAR